MATEIRNPTTTTGNNGAIFWIVLALVVLAGIGYASYTSQKAKTVKVVGSPSSSDSTNPSSNPSAPQTTNMNAEPSTNGNPAGNSQIAITPNTATPDSAGNNTGNNASIDNTNPTSSTYNSSVPTTARTP